MRSMRLAALAVAMTLAFSSLALARDDHYKDHNHYSGHVADHNWKRAVTNNTNNNHHWFEGSQARERERQHAIWEREHRNGAYGTGQVYNRYPYPTGGYGYPNGGYGYPNGGYGYPGSVGRGTYGSRGSSGAGYSQGMQDGSYQARKDVSQGKPFNPNPRGASHSDHGYNSSMGDKYAYQASYDQGYRAGYQSNYGGRGGRGYGF